MNSIQLHRHEIMLLPESTRVLIRPFIPSEMHRIIAILGRALDFSEEEVVEKLRVVHQEFDSRHYDIEDLLWQHFLKVQPHIVTPNPLSNAREMLIGALFSGEYSLESAALFNPSIVPHPDQSGVPKGGLRFVMSLRATGEGHISSIEFRAGVIAAKGGITLDPESRYVTLPEIVPNPTYRKRSFVHKFHEMGFDNDCANAVMAPLADNFTRQELNVSVGTVRHENPACTHEHVRTLECIQWLADSNYELRDRKSVV